MIGIDECLLEAMTLPGARGAAIIDWTSGLALGVIGETPAENVETTAAEAAELARIAGEYSTFAPHDDSASSPTGRGGTDTEAKGTPVEDVIVTSRTCYHVLRFVETTFDSSVFLHLWLDRDTGNLAMARIRLQDLAERLTLG